MNALFGEGTKSPDGPLRGLWDSVGGGRMPRPSSEGTSHLDSKLVDAASEGWNGERPDSFLFSDFGTFRRHLNEDDPSDAPRRLADAHITLLMGILYN